MKTPGTNLEQAQPAPLSGANGASAQRAKPGFERLGESLYWKGGTIFARVRVNGKQTWRATGTDNPKDAREWLRKWQRDAWLLKNGIEPKGVVLQRQRVSVREVVEAYVEAGLPTRTMRLK